MPAERHHVTDLEPEKLWSRLRDQRHPPGELPRAQRHRTGSCAAARTTATRSSCRSRSDRSARSRSRRAARHSRRAPRWPAGIPAPGHDPPERVGDTRRARRRRSLRPYSKVRDVKPRAGSQGAERPTADGVDRAISQRHARFWVTKTNSRRGRSGASLTSRTVNPARARLSSSSVRERNRSVESETIRVPSGKS
jgi:hypothetical protein